MCVEWFEGMMINETFLWFDQIICCFVELHKNYKCWQMADDASRKQCGCLKLYSEEDHFDKDDNHLYESCDYPGYKKSLDDHCQ